jgi:hypothetical protein
MPTTATERFLAKASLTGDHPKPNMMRPAPPAGRIRVLHPHPACQTRLTPLSR